jgi:phosphoglucosamine mutase
MVSAVLAHGADYGVALDGDADRLQMVDAQGRLYNGDELLFVLAQDRLSQSLPLPGVVGTLMTNMAVELALRAQGVEVVRAKVGDRYVLEALEARGWLLGGEGSGHLLALDKHSTGDGMVSALQVLQACVNQRKSLAQILNGVTLFPQTLLNARTPKGFDWTAHTPLHNEIARVQAELGDQGRVLVRPSGTEPLLRIMVESSDAQRSLALAQRMAQTLPKEA